MRSISGFGLQVVVAASVTLGTRSASSQRVPETVADAIEFRSIGPAVFGGRITDIEIVPDQPFMLFVAGASGGLFRSENNGTTWECIFQNEGTISIGDIAVQADNPEVIWVGTGEANNQRSCYWGDGVYKTTDGGKTWTNTGLSDSHHIGRIVIDPNDPDTVYVAAAGHQYTFNDERGLYKTTDGGETWTQSLAISSEVGVIDVVINPEDSNVLYAASYERLRRPWNFDGAGPGSAIYKSTDAGESWMRLEGGLPDGEIGRIGLAMYPGDPKTLYATVSNQNPQVSDEDREPDLGFEAEWTDDGWRITSVDEGTSAAEQGLAEGDIVTSIAGVAIESVWSVMIALSDKSAADDAEIVVARGDEEVAVTIALGRIDPRARRSNRTIGGEIYRTDDAGDTWTRVNEQPVGGSPAYYYGQIRIDPTDVNRLYILSVPVSMSDDGGKTWSGNIAGSVHVDHHALVVDPNNADRLILGNDGGLAISYDRGQTWDHYRNLPLSQFYAVGVDMQRPYHVYGGTQDNGTWGGPSTTPRGVNEADWYNVGGGDGFYAQVDPRNSDIVYAESQFGAVFRVDKSTGERASIRPRQDDAHERYRFNWNSPILISHHNPEIIYFGGNRLFKSFNRGDTWAIVTDDLTTADEEKIAGNVPHCTITTIAESPIDPRVVVVGTDDGLVQWSEDGGLSFVNVADRMPDLPAAWWCSRVELSRHDVNVAYASFTGYREDDFRPLLYKTTDRGTTWEPIVDGLPNEPINVVREDPRNAELLFIGTEFGVWASVDAGETWTELDANLPTIPVHDLVVHPRDRDLVIATHGRGFFVADVGALQELDAEALASDVHLFSIEDVARPGFVNTFGWSGDRSFTGEPAPTGAAIRFLLGAGFDSTAEMSITVKDVAGEIIRELEVPETARTPGMHTMMWDLRRQRQDNQEGGRGRRFGGAPVGPGEYTVTLQVGDDQLVQTLTILD